MAYNAEYDRQRYEEIKSDPVRYRAYLDQKRRQRHARQIDRLAETERKQKWRAANQGRTTLHRRAMYAVENALRHGRIIKPANCSHCGCGGKLEAHHFLGHEQAHWLDIVWLCIMCHHAQHPHPGKKAVALTDGQEKV